jgi:hypothetical protein
LNVTQHLYLLLKSRRWSDFRKTLGSYVHLVEGSNDTVVLQVPLEVPSKTSIVSFDESRETVDEPEVIALPDEPRQALVPTGNLSVDPHDTRETTPAEAITVAVKLQRVTKDSPLDSELQKEAAYLEQGTMTVRQGVCVHFPLMMAHIVYDAHEGLEGPGSGRWHALVNEWADGDLGHLYTAHRIEDDPHTIHSYHRQATIQSLMGVYTMNHVWGVFHNDLHPKNVLFVYLPTPTTFVYDLPSTESDDKYRLILHDANVLCLIWDFSKVESSSELGSNDVYEFFSQASDLHPALVSEVRRLAGYSPAETKNVFPWILSLIRAWAETDPMISLVRLAKEEVKSVPLPHPCVYSSMEDCVNKFI